MTDALLFDVEGFACGLAKGLRPVVAAALQKAAEELGAEESGSKLPHSKITEEEANEFLDGREVVWRQEAERIGREIEEAAAEMQNAECRMQNVNARADAVRAKFNEIAKRRAPALAREEMEAVLREMQKAECKMQNGPTRTFPAAWVERATRPSRRATGPAEDGGHPFCKETASDGRMSSPVPVGESPTGTGGSPVPPTVRGMGTRPLRRMIHPEVRVVDARQGIVDYIASDESIDSYKEVIRAAGWRFTHFAKNAPFVDSHDYSTIGKCLGKVIDFRVEGARLIERVQWAIDVPENQLAQIGWKMTAAGYLKAVSVGFFPVKYVTPHSGEEWTRQLQELGLPADAAVRTIYTEQEQVELSCCVVASNPNALAKALQAGAIDDADIEVIASEVWRLDVPHPGAGGGGQGTARPASEGDWRRASEQQISLEYSQRENGRAADCPAPAAPAPGQARARFLEELHRAMKQTQ